MTGGVIAVEGVEVVEEVEIEEEVVAGAITIQIEEVAAAIMIQEEAQVMEENGNVVGVEDEEVNPKEATGIEMIEDQVVDHLHYPD